jgi:protein HIRA/HIR1
MIWIKSNYGGGTIFGGGGKVHVESWRLHQTLRGHNGDVLDLAWGPGDGLLATASVDNSVIIWNADNLPEMIKILKGHTGLVKGVIFDPVGKFLASQSDDRTLRIWRTSDWSQDVVIDQPFVDSGATTHVLR